MIEAESKNNKFPCLIFRLLQTQYDYRYTYVVGLWTDNKQAIIGVEFNYKAAMQGATSRYVSYLTNAEA